MSDDRLARWQKLTGASLFIGYCGYYFCRSNLSIATPYLLEQFSKSEIGLVATVGTGFYAAGKMINGVLGDVVGGRRIFLLGMIGSIVCTIVFGAGAGFGLMIAAWAANRFLQSMGWGALVKVASNWYPFERHGTVMGLLSLSFLFGDAIARFVLGQILSFGASWQGMFFSAAAVLGGAFLLNRAVLKDRPSDRGLPEPAANPANLFAGDVEKRQSLGQLLAPFMSSRAFWLVTAMSVGLTLIREAFGLWTPTYFTEVAQLPKATAGTLSLVFPLFGGVAVLGAGTITDRLSGGRRGPMITVCLLGLTLVLIALSRIDAAANPALAIALVSLAALLLTGPYSFLAGVLSIDLGGKRAASTAAGLVDGAGYLAGMASGWVIGRIAEVSGWSAVFLFLGATAAVTAIAGASYLFLERATAIGARARPG